MAMPLTVPPKTGHKSFLYSPVQTDLDTLDAAYRFSRHPAWSIPIPWRT